MKKFEYEITEHIAVLSENGDTTKEVNLISYNGAPAKYDIRMWKDNDGEKKMLKGITLTSEEMSALKDALYNMTFE